jgi:E3 SUMO-protein ligase PIAS1
MHHTSNHLSSRVVGLPAPHYMGPRQSPEVQGQAERAHVYRSGPVLDQLMLQTRMLNRSALAASSQNSAAALVRPAQADIQSYLLPAQQRQALRSQAVPRASTPQAVPRAPPHMQPPSPSVSTTVAPITPQVGISDGPPEHPVDENWRPTGRMRGSLTGSAYDKAIDRYLGQPPSMSDARRPH